MSKIGLVVEGGGMKCAYSAGVLDVFLDNGITFDYCIGVSAGSANTASFMGGQRGRSERFYTKHIKEPMYFGVKSLLKNGNLFNLQYIYGTLSNEDGNDPLDYDKVMENPAEFEVVATNALTGKPAYFGKSEMIRNNYVHIMASSAIPIVSKPVFIGGVPYYDGGVSDSIPVQRAFDQGCDKVVCVLSKSRNYVKQPGKGSALYSLFCSKYPNAVKAMKNRYLMYKENQDTMFAAEKEGRAFLFSLETDLKISTYKMDAAVNRSLYELGLADGQEKLEELQSFMKK